MTVNATQLSPRQRWNDGAWARFGLFGNLVMMVLFIVGLPFAAAFALFVGVGCTLLEWAGRPFSPSRRAANKAARRWRSGAARRALQAADLGELAEVLSESLADPSVRAPLELSSLGDKLIISFPATPAFASIQGHTKLSADGHAAAKVLGACLREASYRIDVIGYMPATHREDAKGALISRGRASALADALKKAGCAQHITVFGAGAGRAGARSAAGADVILRQPPVSGRRAA